MNQIEGLSPAAARAWKRLESEFPLWREHLDVRDGELEFSVAAPAGSMAGHLVVFSDQNNLWVRFSPPCACYLVDDENEMVSIIRQLTSDEALFKVTMKKVTMKGDEWLETTLVRPQQKSEPLPGQSVCYISWSGQF